MPMGELQNALLNVYIIFNMKQVVLLLLSCSLVGLLVATDADRQRDDSQNGLMRR